MKLEVEQKEKVFEPIKVTLTLESKDELIDLMLRFNVSLSKANEHGGFDGVEAKSHNFSAAFFALQNIYDKLPK